MEWHIKKNFLFIQQIPGIENYLGIFFINFAAKLYGCSGVSTYNIDKALITK